MGTPLISNVYYEPTERFKIKSVMHNGNKPYSLIMKIMNRKGVLQIRYLVTKAENIIST